MRMPARVIFAAGISALLLVAAFVPAASAGPPSGRYQPGVLASFPAGLVCPAAVGDVTANYLSGNWSLVGKSDGRLFQGMGTGWFEVSGSKTGKAVVLQVSGVSIYSADGNELTSAGKALWAFFPGDAGPGNQSVGRVLYFVGTQTTDWLAGTFTYSGRLLGNICDQLI